MLVKEFRKKLTCDNNISNTTIHGSYYKMEMCLLTCADGMENGKISSSGHFFLISSLFGD